MAVRRDRGFAVGPVNSQADVLRGRATLRAAQDHPGACRRTAPDTITAARLVDPRAPSTRRRLCGPVECRVNLLLAWPCCLSLGTLPTGTTTVFLQFVGAVDRGERIWSLLKPLSRSGSTWPMPRRAPPVSFYASKAHDRLGAICALEKRAAPR